MAQEVKDSRKKSVKSNDDDAEQVSVAMKWRKIRLWTKTLKKYQVLIEEVDI